MPTPITPGGIEHGPVREIWFAKLSAPSTKYSFLIRDDAYSKGGAIFGRTIRLGDPVTLGPNSTWVQNTWEGGGKQEVWKDKAMYDQGNLDVSSKRGKVKLWPGFQMAQANGNRANTRYIMCPGNIGQGADTPLYVAENNDNGYIDPTSGTTVPPGGFALFRFDPGTGSSTNIYNFPAGVRAMVPVNDQGNSVFYLFITTADGKYYIYNSNTNTMVHEVDGDPVLPNSACVFNDAVFYGAGNVLSKRLWTTPGPATFPIVKQFNNSLGIAAMTVWNNRLWMAVQNAGGFTQVFVSDGVSVVPAFTFPSTFIPTHMMTHYGALYFSGWVQGNLGTSGVRGQIWKYNGSSLTKLYEIGTSADSEFHYPFQMASYKQYLVWTKNGFQSTIWQPGVTMYDAEVDAIIDGPVVDTDAATFEIYTTGLAVWGDTLVASFRDQHTYISGVKNPCMVAFVKLNGGTNATIPTSFGGHSFDNPSDPVRFVLSSTFDGDIPAEQKNWLVARIRCKVPTNTRIAMTILLDDSPTEINVGSIFPPASPGNWFTGVLPLKSAGLYLKSTTIKYKLYLVQEDPSSSSTANPEVDSVSIDYTPSPTKRREWRVRALCNDGQSRLDGSPNPITTTQGQIDKLEELWAGQDPVLFWDAGTAGGTPVTGGTEVTLKDFQAQSFRVQTTSTEIAAEVSVGLTELVL